MYIEVDTYAMRQYTRLDDVSKILDLLLSNISDSTLKRDAFVHLYGTGQAASMIALMRGLSRKEAELSSIAGMLHDLYKYVAPNDNEGHANKCAHYAKEMVLDRLDSFTEEEKSLIFTAIARHNRKEEIDEPIDEVLKDADVLQHLLRSPMDDCFYNKSRAQKALKELMK
ncbi:MAG: HD domain-containing protein [Bacilli bacterium]|nr:HD domain-containing protein [Bacilli bacterium]